MGIISIVVSDDYSCRIDSYLASKTNFSRSLIEKLISNGAVFVNEKSVLKKYIPRAGDKIVILPPVFSGKNIIAKDIPLNIIYEDNYLLVVDKPKGMVTHPAPGHYDDTLVNALMFYTKNLSDLNGNFRPGIVHRLDKDTSGLLLIAKNNYVHENLALQIKNKTARRNYLGVVHGVFKSASGTIDMPIGRDRYNRQKMTVTDKNSRQAITHYQVLKSSSRYSFVKFSLETGRTHQIRVHFSKIGHPLVGDITYGAPNGSSTLNGQCLHAFEIGFEHPITCKKMSFFSALPSYFKNFLFEVF